MKEFILSVLASILATLIVDAIKDHDEKRQYGKGENPLL